MYVGKLLKVMGFITVDRFVSRLTVYAVYFCFELTKIFETHLTDLNSDMKCFCHKIGS